MRRFLLASFATLVLASAVPAHALSPSQVTRAAAAAASSVPSPDDMGWQKK